ncbi:MAG TPA: hypothetical protein VFE82_02975 [Ramlibacter sp.]|jgi:hypothetical protein|uniref:hypothetical protein n=1 Tax=Ramlibacter sp. TaxID=1917967 RepID=UPI002D28246E|nr:hypothetical protein [Ramlibacter sp.]HZY17413.1 hypothetical protein [Ramlibacter sp.]
MRANTKTTTLSLLLAGLLGAGAAFAENNPSGTADVSTGGQSSTMSGGVPNMATTNQPAAAPVPSTSTMGAAPAPYSGATAPVYGAEPQAARSAPRATYGGASTMDIPVRGGEVSTMTEGRPNFVTNNHTPDGSIGDARHVQPAPVVVQGTGEASTLVGGRPNANPEDPVVVRSLAERRAAYEAEQAERMRLRQQSTLGNSAAPAGSQ